MEIRWLGHACFLITSAQGATILTDPPVLEVGYPPVEARADVVTVSHHHYDHNGVFLLPGNPRVIDRPGISREAGLTFQGVSTFHDREGGLRRGNNLVFVFQVEGVRICHLGDLGHPLDDVKVAEVGPVDILMVPVGGCYTIDGSEAAEVVGALKPRIVLPMHYKTAVLSPDIRVGPVDEFLRHFGRVSQEEVLKVDGGTLPSPMQVVVLTYPRQLV